MAAHDIAVALRNVEGAMLLAPETGLGEDASATARWNGNTKVVTRHPNGAQLETDMPKALGGTGDQVSPGWLFRAALASCAATRIAMSAASEGIELDTLEVLASSRSDVRGLLGLADADGTAVGAGPRDVQLLVRISAPGVQAERLRAMVEASHRQSPVSCAAQQALPVALRIEVDGH